ncbi:MAG: superoxide dismutase [Turicibacter sp.]|jgi:Fe-Mn family superoxide dismutase|uniref:Superoxide dismutase n=1 Tax=Turicibacter faecis TaxID=2963365 RepID=A0ABM8IHG7_9FIRM|nr:MULTISPECIES: superoxide dismutase [unclassified Turicibacter]MCI8702137.1 superoxide dismutase [Turicibacter sp.]MCU7205058.1 superoxide dismutase [Turicibacter sp. TA25]NCE78513.1 superoxide dismutase [Turicibacter sp. TS3]BEH90664.1 superoxide dismutase [Mn] [Turicibacter sp. TC023]
MTEYPFLPLPYTYNALEPILDAKTVEIHYTKHHKAYLDKLNALVKRYPSFFEGKTIEDVLSHPDEIPADIRQEVINQGGGYANHNLYFYSLSPNGGGEPFGKLAKEIKLAFGSFDQLKRLLAQAATSQFGSGYGWLVLDQNKKLRVVKTLNQNSPLSAGFTPLLNLDVWEHAYYLKYQNRRADYTEAIFEIINWDEVERRFEEGLRK